MAEKNGKGGHGPRCVALVGPQGSGKTTLLESILWITGAITRKGSQSQHNTVGDASPEARDRLMSVELAAATTNYLGEHFSFVDCPGSIEFLQESLNAIIGVDAVVVVAEPDPAKAQMLQPMLKRLSDLAIPHFLFINKVDKAQGSMRDLLVALQPAAPKPLVLRQVPIWKDGAVTGFVDLALERAFVYREHSPSEVIAIPADVADREHEARFQMLEKLADYDDHLMEELLSDVEPPRDEIFADLSRELAEGLIVPVLIGSAEKDNGVRRLLKALRHECPDVGRAAARQGVAAGDDTVLQVIKTIHGAGGKLSLARVFKGILKDGATLARSEGGEERASGLFSLTGEKQTKIPAAGAGDLVAIGRLEKVQTGETLAAPKAVKALKTAEILPPAYKLAIKAADRKDDVKLSSAIAKLREEDPAIGFDHVAETHEAVLVGQGEVHLKTALARTERKFGLKLDTHPPHVGYRETIRKPIEQRGRHKKQSGGHGQFGDIVIQIKPQPRGGGFEFVDKIAGGVVPRQFIPSVEKGVRDYLHKGPLGFPVVDVSVTLIDGSYHSVDSSDAAFQQAARIGMTEGMAQCNPVLLEPITVVEVNTPSDSTSRINQIITGKRGQLLGYDGRPGWPGWDVVRAHVPESELQNFIIELRSATQGAANFSYRFDHLSELTGKLADNAIALKSQAA